MMPTLSRDDAPLHETGKDLTQKTEASRSAADDQFIAMQTVNLAIDRVIRLFDERGEQALPSPPLIPSASTRTLCRRDSRRWLQ